MRLEHIPIVLGSIVSLLAAFVLYDAFASENVRPFRERRRRQRAEINVPGEVLVGLGIGALAAALFGGETWRWTTIAVMTGTVLIIVGAVLNRAWLREMLLYRGAARRTEEHEVPPVAYHDDSRKLRIR
jgi:protein-S-isoprenylcysteine O-methyltransferase Ste14